MADFNNNTTSEVAPKYCQNCGTELQGPYCHNCGQNAAIDRITLKAFFKESIWNALHMDNRVLPTIWLLITRPWILVRDYIKGHRVIYTNPVRIIIILCLVELAINGLLGIGEIVKPIGLLDIEKIGNERLYRILDFVINTILLSDVVFSLIISLPMSALTYWICRPFGATRYNLAECSIAFLYFMAMQQAAFIACLPFRIVEWWLQPVISYTYSIVLTIIFLAKALHIQSFWKLTKLLLALIFAFAGIGFAIIMIAASIILITQP